MLLVSLASPSGANAATLSADEKALVRSIAETSPEIAKVVKAALTREDAKYRAGGNGPGEHVGGVVGQHEELDARDKSQDCAEDQRESHQGMGLTVAVVHVGRRGGSLPEREGDRI